jgi:hypothetical protein
MAKYRLLGTTPFDVLGVAPDATQGLAKREFHKLALKYHPDRNAGDEAAAARFKEVADAWAELQAILPGDAVPLVIPDGATEEEIGEIYAAWLLDPSNAAPTRSPTSQAPQRDNVWATVASETTRDTEMTVSGSAPPKDWRHQSIRRWKKGAGLTRIHAEEAANLIYGRPNAFAALRIVQKHDPTLCLYDAILARAYGASRRPPSGGRTSSAALIIVGADAVNPEACEAALRNPLRSVRRALRNTHVIAPQIRLGDTFLSAEKLQVDLEWLGENIETLIRKTARRPRTEGECR